MWFPHIWVAPKTIYISRQLASPAHKIKLWDPPHFTLGSAEQSTDHFFFLNSVQYREMHVYVQRKTTSALLKCYPKMSKLSASLFKGRKVSYFFPIISSEWKTTVFSCLSKMTLLPDHFVPRLPACLLQSGSESLYISSKYCYIKAVLGPWNTLITLG